MFILYELKYYYEYNYYTITNIVLTDHSRNVLFNFVRITTDSLYKFEQKLHKIDTMDSIIVISHVLLVSCLNCLHNR